MAHADGWFLLLALAGFVLGGWHLCWSRCHPESQRGQWGRWLGVSAILCVGGTGLVAAQLHSPWIVPLGLLTGLLVVVMLWEFPEPNWEQSAISDKQ